MRTQEPGIKPSDKPLCFYQSGLRCCQRSTLEVDLTMSKKFKLLPPSPGDRHRRRKASSCGGTLAA